jgi:Chitobiase/beta-hexosaminidase C-terminal domain/Legume lectin domain
MKPFLRGKTLKFRQLAYCLETPAFGILALLGSVAKVFRETRRSVLLTVLSLAVMMLCLLIPRAVRAQVINYPSGFGSSSGQIWLEDASTLSGTDIQLLNGIGHRANNAWYETPVNVQAFTTTFTWYTDCSPAPTECGEGLGFMILSDPNLTAAGFTYAGFSGGQFSWSQCVTPFTGSACPSINSILVKFDMYDDQTLTAGANLTGFYSGGEFPQAPYNPQYDMSGSGINMQSGDLMRSTLTYNGATLTETVTDTVTGATYTNSYAANIPSLVAGNTAFVGFGAGTGAAISNLYLTTWTYSVESPRQAATPTFSPAAGTYASAQSVSISAATSGATIYYTTNGTAPTTSSTQYTGPITVSTTETLKAIAVAAGDTNSAVASAAYTISLLANFMLDASPASLTVDSGDQGTVTLSVTPQNGFDSPVSFACSGLPAGATCTFAPATVTPSGAAATTQLTISAGAQSSALRLGSRPFFPFTALAVTVCLFGWRKRRGWHHWLLLAVAYAGLGLLFACGGSSGTSPTTTPTSPTPTPSSTTWTVNVTATSGTVTGTATITLTVN